MATPRFMDLTGHRYGRLTVIERCGSDKQGKPMWLCHCDCGGTAVVRASRLRGGRTGSCGCLKGTHAWHGHPMPQGKDSPLWKGGRYVEANGYVKVNIKEHPHSDHNGWIYEHRFVMENHLGRYLKKHEQVHHKNGIRNDNRIENLELWSGSHGSGVRASDTKSDVVEIKILRRQNPSIINSL